MVTAVRDGRHQQSDSEPEAGGGDVRPEQDRSRQSRQHVGQLHTDHGISAQTHCTGHMSTSEPGSYHMLHRMSVERHHSDRSRPLVMDLVDALIERRMVDEPERSR